MEGSFIHKLQVWEDRTTGVVVDCGQAVPFAAERVADRQQAETLAARETWRPIPVRKPADALEPFSLPWFLEVERKRYARHGNWIPKLLEFAKHPGERLLALGDGLGTDWVRYARHGSQVVVCSPSAEHLALMRRNFELRGLAGAFLHGHLSRLPLEDASLDVACLSDLKLGPEGLEAVVAEVYRVLKPGGKVIAVVPARFDAAYWEGVFFPWQHWFRGRAPDDPGDPAFGARQLCRVFGRFAEHRVYKRHLRRSDLPHVWRWMLLPLLGRLMGRFLILKAFKPLSAAHAPAEAAA